MDPLTLIGAIPTALNTVNSLTSLFQGPYQPPKHFQENSREVFKQGGKIRGHNKYNAPTHAQGGQLVNDQGIPSPTGTNEIEKKESKYTYTRLNKKNPTYIFNPKDTKKVDKLVDKYSKSNTDSLEKNALELEVQRVEKDNEMKKAKAQKKQFKSGGKIKKYSGGGPLEPLFGLPKNYSTMSDKPMQQIQTSNERYPLASTPLTGMKKGVDGMGFGKAPTAPTSPKTSNPLKTLDALRDLTFAGSSLGLLKGSQKEDPIMTDYGAARNELNKLSSNLDPLREQAAQTSNQLRNVNRNSSTSATGFANREAQRVANLQQTLSGIGLQERQLGNQIAGQRASFEQGVAQDNKQTLQQNRINNQQNQAAGNRIKSEIVADNLGELDRKASVINQANITEGNTIESMAYLSTMFENFGPGDMSIVMKVKKSGMSSLTPQEKEQMLNWQPIKFKK